MRSPVYWALLGLVIERAGYGYELLKRFERDFGEVLPISSDSHIYRALSVLQSKGLIEELPAGGGEHPSRQPRPHYRATAEGVCGYRNWLISQVHAGRRQSSLFLRELAVLIHEPQAALQVIAHCERVWLEEADRGPEPAAGSPPGDAASRLAAALSAEERRLVMQAQLPWIQYARRRFTALAEARIVADEPA
jgi:DNA-binding PadR family transcriptional regulator